MLLVKLGYTSTVIGQFEYFLFTANALTFFWAMGMKNALLSYSPQFGRKDTKSLLRSVSLLFLLISFCLGLAVILFSIYRPDYGVDGIRFYLALFLVLNTPSQLIEIILIIRKEAAALFWETILFYVGLLFLVIFTCYSLESMLAPVLAFLFWGAYRFLYFLILVFRSKGEFSWAMLRGFVVFSFPLILHVLLGNGMEFVDGFIVKYFFDDDMFAYYRYGAKELPINSVIITAMALALIPTATQDFEEGKTQIKKRISRIMDWMFPLTAVLIIVSPYLFAFFFSEEYVTSARIFNIYLLILISRVILAQVLMYAKHLNKELMYIALIEIVINIVLSLILVNTYGVIGIAYATLVAYIVQKVLLVLYCRKYLGVTFSEYMDTKKYYLYVVALCFVYIVSFY